MAIQRPPLVNLTPKQRFQESSDSIAKHREMVDSKEFERAVDFAMRQYQLELTREMTPNNAACIAFQLRGAEEFAVCLRNISEKPQPMPKPAPIPQLDHNA